MVDEARRNCSLCGKFLGRQIGRGSHYNCRVALERALNALTTSLSIAGALCRAHAVGEGSGYEWATRVPFYPRWEPGCRRDIHLAEDERKQPGAFADIYGDRANWRKP
jgi:hypothetical protein